MELPFRVLGGARFGVSSVDSLKRQTFAATPAEPGGLPCRASPLELELRYAELDEHVSQLVDIIWTFVGALARAHGYTDADWHVAEQSFRDALDEC